MWISKEFLFKKVHTWVVLLFALLFIPLVVIWAFCVSQYNFFPYFTFKEIRMFISGNEFDNRTVWQRFVAELNNIQVLKNYDHSPPKVDADSRVELQTTLGDGFYVVYGLLTIKGILQPTALLLDTNGDVRRCWVFPFVDTERTPRRLQISDNGILVSSSIDKLRAQSWCGQSLWDLGTQVFHHEIDYGNGKFTVWMRDKIVEIDEKTGSLQEIIDTKKIVLANPEIASLRSTLRNFSYLRSNNNMLFDNKQLGKTGGKYKSIFIGDNFHQNKVAVNNGVSDKYPDDSLLISFRQIDLVAIIDPETGKVLWHKYFDRQHDPDWLENGILVYNNRAHFDYSTIELVPFAGERQVLVGPSKYRWYRHATGNSQLYTDGSILFQGKENEALHIDKEGGILTHISFLEGTMRNAYFFTNDQIEQWESQCK